MPKVLKPTIQQQLLKRLDIKILLRDEFGLDQEWGIRCVNRWIKRNRPNGQLTSKASLEILKKWLNVPERDLLQEANDDPTFEKGGRGNTAPVSRQIG